MMRMGLPSGKLTQLWKDPPSFICKSTINGQFSIAMLNYQRVCGMNILRQPEDMIIYWVHVVSCLVSPEVVSGRCAVGKCV